ncbi:MAG: hypothetical protein ACAI38_25000 [Myxococcota bacterium]|nr:hypothetical protein [Myxococcota bacterium]
MVSKVQNTNVEKLSSFTSGPTAQKRAPSTVPSAVADTVGAGGTASVVVLTEAAPATGANPFAALLTATSDVAAAELRLASSADATSASCEAHLGVLTVLAEIESRVTPRDAWGPSKVRHGYMQVTYDAQEERVAASLLERDAGEQLARVLVERPAKTDAKEIIHAQEWRVAVGGYFKGGDVNAFVQQVLRECYLLGMTDLQLYGDRLKALNELKKKIREEADRARKMKSEWATAAKGDENWVAPYLYAPVKVDGAQLALIPATYTQEELDEQKDRQQGELIGKDGEPNNESAPAANDFWEGNSLEPEDRAWVQTISGVKNDKIRNEKSIFEDLKELVPKMSEADIRELLVPILENFEKHGHEGGILELVRVMSPEQRLVVAAAGFGSDGSAFWYTPSAGSKPHDEFSVEERAEYNSLLVGAAYELMGDEVTVAGSGLSTAQAGEIVTAYKEKLEGPKVVSSPGQSHGRLGERGRLVGADLAGRQNLAVQKGAQTAAETTGPQAGAAKTIDTVAEMDDYLKYLEEQMNSVGDDAQLANIDLQNCLQKQQQTLQMMSNISKVLHDVTMAIIRNMNS